MKWSSFKYLVKQGWHSMVANRLMTLASIGVLVACLMITGVAALLSVNVTSYVDYLETLNEIVFFIDDAAPPETVEALKTQIPADRERGCLRIRPQGCGRGGNAGVSGRLRRYHERLCRRREHRKSAARFVPRVGDRRCGPCAHSGAHQGHGRRIRPRPRTAPPAMRTCFTK